MRLIFQGMDDRFFRRGAFGQREFLFVFGIGIPNDEAHAIEFIMDNQVNGVINGREIGCVLGFEGPLEIAHVVVSRPNMTQQYSHLAINRRSGY